MPTETDLSWTVRVGTPADADALCRIHRESILGLGGTGYRPEELESWAAGLAPARYVEAMTERGERFFVAEHRQAGPVGFSSFRDEELIALYVMPGWNRRGIGAALLANAETAMTAAGHRCCRISAARSALAFYKNRGYRVTKEKDWTTRGGLVIRSYDMVRHFDQQPE